MNVYSMQRPAIKRFHQTSDRKCCPECGDSMIEVDRSNENGALFVWHECSKNDCNGQWLQKIPHKVQNNHASGISQ